MIYFENWCPQKVTVSAKRRPVFSKYAHRGDVLWHSQADNSFEAEIGKSVTDRSKRSFRRQSLAPISGHQAVCDVDLAEFFEIFQAGKADVFAATFENAGAAAESVFAVVRDWVIDEDLAGLLDTLQRFVGNEPQHFRIGVQFEERLRVFCHIFSHEQSIGLENDLHDKSAPSSSRRRNS